MSSKIALAFLIGCCVLLGLAYAETNGYHPAQRRNIQNSYVARAGYPQGTASHGHIRRSKIRNAGGFPDIHDQNDQGPSGQDQNDSNNNEYADLEDSEDSTTGSPVAPAPGFEPNQKVLASGNKDRFAKA